MNRYMSLLFILALSALLGPGCMASKNARTTLQEGTLQMGRPVAHEVQDRSGTLEDARITSAIRTMFTEDEVLFASKIDVDTSHRTVTLTGSVGSKADAYRALRLGRSVGGVKTVHSFIVVR